MKIEQDAQFRPITLVIETNREAEAIWAAIRAYDTPGDLQGSKICIALSDWFNTKAQMGGA